MKINNTERFSIRNAESTDFASIRALMTQQYAKFFGPCKRKTFHASAFFELYATHRMVVRDNPNDDHIIAYAEFKNYPLIKTLPKDMWMQWMNFHFCVNLPLTVTNTLFFSHFIYNVEFSPDVFGNILCEIFLREPKLRFINIVEPPFFAHKFKEDNADYSILKNFATSFYPKDFHLGLCVNTTKLHIINRNDVIPLMRYRKALPEDNDDIIQIADVEHPELKRDLGEFYIAEELIREEPHKRIIVTEVDHQTAGFIWLNDNIDIVKLIHNYELESFGNLMKFSLSDHLKTKHIRIIDQEHKDKSELFTADKIADIFQNNVFGSFVINSLSSFTLKSQYNCRVSSITGSITASKETFFLKEEFLKKIQILNEEIRSTKYYIKDRERVSRVQYNAHHKFGDNIQSNVFTLQLFGIDSSNDLRKMFRFLAASFSSYMDKDYCIISIPVTWEILPSLQTILRFFIPVIPRPNNTINDLLFITHRSCVFGDISVHTATFEDLPHIEKILVYGSVELSQHNTDASIYSPIPPPATFVHQNETDIVHEIMYEVFNNDYSDYKFLTIRVGNSANPLELNVIIGFAIVRQFTQFHLLKETYDICIDSDALNFATGEVVMLKVHPLFRFESSFIFREVARISGYWNFYYFYPTLNRISPLTNDILIRMEPIEPKRRKKIYYGEPLSFKSRQSIVAITQLNYRDDNYALYHHNLHQTKYFGTRHTYVVIGFNDTCKAFLRLMIFNWNTLEKSSKVSQKYCCLPRVNITVIAEPGVVEAEHDVDFECAYCSSHDLCWVNWQNADTFIKDATVRMDLRKWIKFVTGKVKFIDRDRKMVILENDCEIFYNTVILMCATDFGVPNNVTPSDKMPPNFQYINNRLDKILMYHTIQILVEEKKIKGHDIRIVVYGEHVRTFEFVNFLLLHGISGNSITLALCCGKIEDTLKLNNPFDDRNIEVILQEMVEDQGVTVYDHAHLLHWTCYEHDPNIESITFEVASLEEQLTVTCNLFVVFIEADIEKKSLDFLQASGIEILDGQILVDYTYRTNDPLILAVGNCTRHRYPQNYQDRYVSAQEVAEKLIVNFGKEAEEDEFSVDHKYYQPNMSISQLPFDYYMAKVILPKKYLANHLSNEYSYYLTTYYEGDFCRVRLNVHYVVVEIVCITQKIICFDFLKFFCGKHEALLNNLRVRWYMGYVVNFLDFFQEPWTELIMHENFEELRQQNRELIIDTANTIMQCNTDSGRKERHELMLRYLNDMGVDRELEEIFLNFLRTYRSQFQFPFALPEDFTQKISY